MLWHIKTKDLYTVLSVAKDKSNSNESVGAYLNSLVPKQYADHKNYNKRRLDT